MLRDFRADVLFFRSYVPFNKYPKRWARLLSRDEQSGGSGLLCNDKASRSGLPNSRLHNISWPVLLHSTCQTGPPSLIPLVLSVSHDQTPLRLRRRRHSFVYRDPVRSCGRKSLAVDSYRKHRICQQSYVLTWRLLINRLNLGLTW